MAATNDGGALGAWALLLACLVIGAGLCWFGYAMYRISSRASARLEDAVQVQAEVISIRYETHPQTRDASEWYATVLGIGSMFLGVFIFIEFPPWVR